jgi:hypothetical protein
MCTISTMLVGQPVIGWQSVEMDTQVFSKHVILRLHPTKKKVTLPRQVKIRSIAKEIAKMP